MRANRYGRLDTIIDIWIKGMLVVNMVVVTVGIVALIILAILFLIGVTW